MLKFPILILSAGYGKRMLNLSEYTPKPLLKIKNQTLLENTINFFNEIGCKEILINTHYLHNKIENYIIQNFKDHPIKLIYEPTILGTGGGIKNVFNYTKSKKICVVNSDIFWKNENKSDIINFIKDINIVNYCKILLSKENNFFGLKKNTGDFNIKNGIVLNWDKKEDINFYSGLQIVTKEIFDKKPKIFSMNDLWQSLIINKNLKGSFIYSNITHIGDKNSFEQH